MSRQTEILVTNIDTIDLEDFCSLQKTSFASLLNESGVSYDFLTPDFFRWKYSGPAGKAKIAIVKKANKIVAGVSMFPLLAVKANRFYRVWHSGDVAVLPEFRGRFFFNQCMNILKAGIPTEDFLFGFPNHNNLSGAIRAGFHKLNDLSFYCRPNSFFEFGMKINENESFSSLQDKYAVSLSEKNETMIYRSSEYMNWRYIEKPSSSYFSYSCIEDGKVIGNVVARVAIVRGVRILLVMEYHFISKKAIPQLIKFLNQKSKQYKCIVSIMLFSAGQPKSLRYGFIKLPTYFQPKKIAIYGNELKNENHQLSKTGWFCQTGDWDAF